MMNNQTKNIHSDTLCTVISGSFRKHLREIMLLKQLLENAHVTVLSPTGNCAVNPHEEFVVLDSDPVTHPKLLQDSVFAKIRRSTFLVVANFDGYLGKAAILEIGYAIATGISIYAIEPVEDPNLSPYCTPISAVFPNINFSLVKDVKLSQAAPDKELQDCSQLTRLKMHVNKLTEN